MSPSKRAFQKYKPRGVFSEFYGILESFRTTRIERGLCSLKRLTEILRTTLYYTSF